MFGSWLGRWTVVPEGQAGLFYRDGVYVHEYGPGRVRVGEREALTLVDLREQMIIVSGQEVMSSDSFQPKVSAVVAYRVSDARASVSRQTPPMTLLSTEVALAMRALAASMTAESLAKGDRDLLDAGLLARVQAGCAGQAIEVLSVRLRDVVLPAELRRLLTGVERARREGQAALERAHAEQAALRALANAARLLRNNPELQNLRLLQAIGTAGAPTTVVLGTPAGIVPLREGPVDGG